MDDSCEYKYPVDLSGDSSAYFIVPSSIIFNKDIGEKRLTAFSYASVQRGIDRTLFFSTNMIVKWSGRTPNRRPNGINEKIADSVGKLEDYGYLKISGDYSGSHIADAYFDLSMVLKESEHDRFAIIYADELKSILKYDGFNSGDKLMNNDVVLLVFSYLRMMIYRRPNKLRPEELNADGKNSNKHDIDSRRIRSPEAYNGYYCDIADDIGLSPRIVSRAIDALEEMGLIYTEPLPRIKLGDRWITSHTLFCNTYKREGQKLLDSGSEYYLREIHNKKLKLNAVSKSKEVV